MVAKVEDTIQLRGLPGVRGGRLRAALARTRTAAVRLLRSGVRAVTAADDTGSVTVWRDDAGEWRCEFYRHRVTFNAATFETLAAVGAWLREWWPEMNNPTYRA